MERFEDSKKRMQDSDDAQRSIIESILRPAARKGCSFAVPKALHLPQSTFSSSISPENEAVYVQVDVSVLPAAEFAWHFFMHCHGDFWNMLGPSLRRIGLVLSDLGFCVTHPDIEKHDRRRARIVLSQQPDVVLAFLGLDPAIYWGREQREEVPLGGEYSSAFDTAPSQSKLSGRPFLTEADLFTFVCSSPFFDPSAYAGRIGTLKANDRRRRQLRETYGRFCELWIPRQYPEVSKIAAEQALIESNEANGAVHNDDGLHDSQNKEKLLYHKQRRHIVSADALARFVKQDEWDLRGRRFREEKEALLMKHWGKETKRRILEEEWQYADAWMGRNIAEIYEDKS